MGKTTANYHKKIYGLKIILFIFFFSGVILSTQLLVKIPEEKKLIQFVQKKSNTLGSKIVKITEKPEKIFNLIEIRDFPIYPQAEFVRSEKTSGCIGQNDSAVCGGATYIWISPHDFIKIDDWYKNDKSKSGWRCSGGVSSFKDKRNANLSTICAKLDFTYALELSATESATTISVIIPHKTKSGISTAVISKSKTSPDYTYKIIESFVGDSHSIQIIKKKGKILSEDIISKNYDDIGYGEKILCPCKTSFKGWTDNSHFIISVENSIPEEYEYVVEAKSGNVVPDSLRKIR